MLKVGNNNVSKIILNDNEIKKMYMGESIIYEVSGGDLPQGYTRLKYLQSSGTQWIDTGTLIENSSMSNKKITCRYQFLDVSANGIVWGMFKDAHYIQLGFNVGTGFFMQAHSSWQSSVISTIDYLEVYDFVVDFSTKKYSVGDEEKNFLTLYSGITPIYLFVRNGDFARKTKAKLYSFVIEENGNITQELIPCLDANGVACLYDKSNDNTLYNIGTGTFGYETMDGTIVNPT